MDYPTAIVVLGPNNQQVTESVINPDITPIEQDFHNLHDFFELQIPRCTEGLIDYVTNTLYDEVGRSIVPLQDLVGIYHEVIDTIDITETNRQSVALLRIGAANAVLVIAGESIENAQFGKSPKYGDAPVMFHIDEMLKRYSTEK